MPKYRAIIRRVETSREVVEFDAPGITQAAQHLRDHAANGTRPRGFVVVTPHDQDKHATMADDVVQIAEQ